MAKEKRLIDKYNDIQKIGTTMDVPWEVWTVFYEKKIDIEIIGNDIYLGSDYSPIDKVRNAIEWFATQLGGKVKWEEDSE